MDPTVAVAALGSAAAVIVAVINGRSSADRVRLEERTRRLERYLIDHHREDPDDVKNI